MVSDGIPYNMPYTMLFHAVECDVMRCDSILCDGMVKHTQKRWEKPVFHAQRHHFTNEYQVQYNENTDAESLKRYNFIGCHDEL